MSTTPKSGWTNANRGRPCPICDHDDWCGISPDEKLVLCRRGDEAGTAAKVYTDKSGVAYWPFFLDADGRWTSGFGARGQVDPEADSDTSIEPGTRWYSHEPLGAEDLDRCHRALLGALALTDAHRQRLRNDRGFEDGDIEARLYRSSPSTRADEERALLAVANAVVETYHPGLVAKVRGDRETLAELLGEPAPSISKILKERLSLEEWSEVCQSLFRVPGIWRDDKGLHLGTPPGMLLPIRDYQDRIIGIQVRLDDKVGGKGPRYLPPCPPRRLPDGGVPGSPVGQHVHVPFGGLRRSDDVVVVEGIFKADRTVGTYPNVLGIPSVGAWKLIRPVADAYGAKTIVLAYDADTRRKASVAGALTVAAVEHAKEGFAIEMLDWPQECGKGLDDVLQGGHGDKVVRLTGRDVWRTISERRAQAGLALHPGVEARLVLSDLEDRTAADPSTPFDSVVIESMAKLDEGSREEAKLLQALTKTLGKGGISSLAKRVRAARSKAKATTEEGKTGDESYVYEDGKLQLIASTPAGPCRTVIANFDAKIVGVDLADDDSGEKRTIFQIAGNLGTTPLSTVSVLAEKFSDMKWLDSAWQGRARMEPGRGVADRVRHAIQVRSGSYPTTTTYTHTGWREIDGKQVYLHASGAIGADNVQVRLSDKLAKFDFGTKQLTENEVKDAIAMSFTFLWAATAEITYPLLALTYLAPLRSFFDPRFIVAIIGRSGTRKTALAIELQRHFGTGFRQDGDMPLNFVSTITAIEGMLFAAKDGLTVVDDFFPRRSGRDAEAQDQRASLIARSVGNGQARERSRANLSSQISRPPRSVVLITAEVDPVPPGVDESAANRTLKLHLQADDVDKEELGRVQRLGKPWVAMRAYIEWLLASEGRVAQLVAERDAFVVRLRGHGGLQARAPEIVANLVVAFSALCEFVVAHGMMPSQEADDHRNTCLNILVDLMQDQQAVSQATAPEAIYLDALKALILQGRAPLLAVEQRLDENLTASARPIGWRDAHHVYLLPDAMHEAVVSALRASSQHVPLGVNALYARWVERGWASARTDPKRIGVQRSLGGSRPRVIEMPVSLFDDVPAPAPRSTDVTLEIDEQALVAAFEPADLPN